MSRYLATGESARRFAPSVVSALRPVPSQSNLPGKPQWKASMVWASSSNSFRGGGGGSYGRARAGSGGSQRRPSTHASPAGQGGLQSETHWPKWHVKPSRQAG
ncbi:MAG: hypothetical protein K0R38_6363 [Polyangiaceae bacterium]|jgi:hypothetical protein|nr:hypothetical protein [Polyangiaceae bacterium]